MTFVELNILMSLHHHALFYLQLTLLIMTKNNKTVVFVVLISYTHEENMSSLMYENSDNATH